MIQKLLKLLGVKRETEVKVETPNNVLILTTPVDSQVTDAVTQKPVAKADPTPKKRGRPKKSAK